MKNRIIQLIGCLQDKKGLNERAEVIVICSEIDDLILRMIIKKLIKRTSHSSYNAIDLFSNSGPIGSFAARIELAHRLGIIGKYICNDLQVLRKIRNKFAHKSYDISYSNKEIKDIIKQFQIHTQIKENKFFEPDLNNPKESVHRISIQLYGYLTSLYKKIRPLKQKNII